MAVSGSAFLDDYFIPQVMWCTIKMMDGDLHFQDLPSKAWIIPVGFFSPLQQYWICWPSPETTESAWLPLKCCLTKFLIMAFISHWLNSLWCSSCRQSSVWGDIMKLVNTIKCESICCRSCSLNIPGGSRIPALVLALPLNMIVTLGKALQFASP